MLGEKQYFKMFSFQLCEHIVFSIYFTIFKVSKCSFNFSL